MPINSTSIPSLRAARAVKRRRRAEGGGIFDYSGVGEALPEHIGRERVMDPLVTVPKSVLWDLPKKAVEQSQANPLPGLRREDFTDIPADTSPDPRSPLGGIGIKVPRVGAQPVDPMVGSSLEAGMNVMGGTAFGAPRGAIGAGPAVKSADEVERILEAERKLAGATHEPAAAPAGGIQAPEAAGDVGGGLAGPVGRGASLEEAARQAERWAGQHRPIEGLPVKPQYVEGHGYLQPGPIGVVRDTADAYMRTHRPEIKYAPPTEFRPVDPEHAKSIAQAYEEMKHTPNDPATKASYEAMINETRQQYEAIKKTGLKIEPIPPGSPDPYAANPRLAAHDVAENNHLWFFPTTEGFGTVNKITSNPLLRKMGEKIGDHEMTANDMFRVVHDYFGHLKEGHGFRAAGEDNAWRSHSAMYSDIARPAMTSETRGQNSWVNYGPHGEKNRTASGADTVYADQKVGLMPDWTMYDRGAEPIYAYHGSPHSFDRFTSDKIGSGEGAQAYGHGLYFAENPKVAKAYREQLSAGSAFEKDGKPVRWTDVADDLLGAMKGAQSLHPDQSSTLVDRITRMIESGKSVKAIRRKYDPPAGFEKAWEAGLQAAEAYTFNKRPGHTYKVAIEANPEHFFDWDKPFGEQSPKVQEVMRPIIEDRMKIARDARKRIIAKGAPREVAKLQMEPFWADQPIEKLRGPKMYQMAGLPAVNQTEGHIRSSKRLLESGIPGLKYHDQGSRNLAQGAKSHNYVTFDDNMVRILRKYGVTGIPAAGVAAAAGQEERAAGGRVARQARRRRASGGSTEDLTRRAYEMLETQPERLRAAELPPVEADSEGMSPENYSQLGSVGRGVLNILPNIAKGAFDSSERMRRGEGYDPKPVLDAAMLPMGTGAVAGVPLRGAEMALGAGPVRRVADDTGAAMTAARRSKRYAEPEYNQSGGLIFNKGVEAPPDPAIQTVADPYRMMFPGIYRNPRSIAEEAAARVGPEDPAMKRLFGVTRGDLREMAQGRVGNEDPALRLAKRPSGSLSAQNIQTPQNTQRLTDILGEAGRHEGLRTADAWYIMDPVYRRMVELHGPEAAERYRKLNTTTAMASPGSDVMTEIQRGTGAHWLNEQGRFEDFMKYAGIPEDMRARVKFPNDMRYMAGHPYHRTAQGEPMRKMLESGSIQSDSPKVPLYAHASGVPETGFQTTGPVGDAHFSRGVGLADTRKGPTDVGSSFSRAEYQTLQPWWQHEVAGKVGLESVPAQARLWTALGPQTGVQSELGAPKLELLAKQIMAAAQRLRISPEQARDLVLSGKAGAGLLGGAIAAPAVHDAMRERRAGGAVNTALNVARNIKRAKGGKVHIGPIIGDTGGRADKVPMEVPDGSYVLTADHCSSMGEGNTLAGFEKLKKMFPKSVAAYKAAKSRGPVQRASGGRVPILAADGEFVICPEDIRDRWGDLDEGHRILDHWQTTSRKEHIKTLAALAPPAQD